MTLNSASTVSHCASSSLSLFFFFFFSKCTEACTRMRCGAYETSTRIVECTKRARTKRALALWSVRNEHSHCGAYKTSTRTVECTGSPANMPDPIRIRSGLAGKHWPETGPMSLVHRLASGPNPSGQNLTQSARTRSDPGRFCTVGFGPPVGQRNRV